MGELSFVSLLDIHKVLKEVFLQHQEALLDGNLVRARQLDPGLGRVGEVTQIDTTIIDNLIEDGFIPVVATVASGDDGGSYNVNADLVAADPRNLDLRRELVIAYGKLSDLLIEKGVLASDFVFMICRPRA